MAVHPDSWRYRPEIVSAFQFGMFIFVLTALIGLANATQVFGELARETILTHVHSGTLGWITLGIFGLALILFGGSARRQMGDEKVRNFVLISGVATVAYVIAFWTASFPAKALFGAIQLVVIVGWWWFAYSNARRMGFARLSTPQYALFLSLTSLVVGSTFGALYQALVATGVYAAPTVAGPGATPTGQLDLIGPHVTAQTTGYLILAAFAAIDWRLRPGMGARDRSGDATIYLLFAAGLITVVFLLANQTQAVALANLLQLIAVVLIVIRFGGAVMRTSWGSADGGRHFAIAVPWLVANIFLFIALVVLIIQNQGDFTKIPPGLFPAFSHTIFVGVMTNILFGAIHAQSAARPRAWPWADHLIFWGVNLGLLGLVVALLAAAKDAERFTAPVMGLAILLGIATFTARLQAGPAPQQAAAPA